MMPSCAAPVAANQEVISAAFLNVRRSVLAVFIAIMLIPLGCGQGSNRVATPQGDPIVRVLILENVATVQISANDPPTIRAGSGKLRGSGFPATLKRRSFSPPPVGGLAICRWVPANPHRAGQGRGRSG